MLRGLRSLRLGGALGVATQQPSRFDSSTLNYSIMVPATAASVQITADFFGGLRAGTPIMQKASASCQDCDEVDLRSGITSMLRLPSQTGPATVVVHVITSIGTEVFNTTYTVFVRRASQSATVTGTGFEMRTATAPLPTSKPLAWRDRKWAYSSLPSALIGMKYTMLTCLEAGGRCGSGRHPPIVMNVSVQCTLRLRLLHVFVSYTSWC